MTVKPDDTFSAYNVLHGLCDGLRAMTISRALVLQYGGTPESVAPMDAPLKSAADACHDIIDTYPAFTESHRNAIMSSFNRSLIERLAKRAPGGTTLSEQDIKAFLSIASPDDFSLLISRGLSAKGHIPGMFEIFDQHRGRDPHRIQGLVEVLSNELSPLEKAKTKTGNVAWIDDPVRAISSPLLAPYLISQVKAFPETFHLAVDIALMNDDVESLLRYHLAGFDIPGLSLDDCRLHIESLVDLMRSEHGKLLIHSHTGSLEDFIERGLSGVARKWIEGLGRPA